MPDGVPAVMCGTIFLKGFRSGPEIGSFSLVSPGFGPTLDPGSRCDGFYRANAQRPDLCRALGAGNWAVACT